MTSSFCLLFRMSRAAAPLLINTPSILLLAASPLLAGTAFAQGLQISYGAKGVQTLVYNGVPLENTAAFPADTFHIWHMQATDPAGNVLSSGQYGWGEVNNGESWNPQTNTETYSFSWGTIATQFVQHGDDLDIVVTETNYVSSGIVLNGAEIFPFALHFPSDPAKFSGYSQWWPTTTGPGVSIADYGQGVVAAVAPEESLPLYTGWVNQGTATYAPVLTTTAPGELPTFLPHLNYSLSPGKTLTYTVSLRFAPEGASPDARDAYASFAQTYPSRMTWTDKRILGTAYLASSPIGSNITQPAGFPTNPRRYFNDPTVDITSAAGLQSFQDRVLAQAASNVTNARNMNAQGVITWDVEGEQYPQTTSYVCSPDQIAAVAPEMESTITNPGSVFHGQKLDDAYFKTLTQAGLRVGLCLRPQVFTFGAGNTASQVFLTSNADIVANLENKARYANGRWGATVFYVDSTVDTNGGVLDPAIFEQLITDLPSFLFIPEESTPRYYAYSAPFYSFLDLGSLGTAASVYEVYPNAFGANLVNDANPATLAQFLPQLTSSVAHGDILMGHADYWDANDPTLLAIYRSAGVSTPTPQPPAPPKPTPTRPTLQWSTPAAIAAGLPLSAAQLDATANVPGSFLYTPAAGTVLGPGTHPLNAVFTPADTTRYTTASASVTLTVNSAPAKPALSWPALAPLTYGTALGSVQLNATANVAGSFRYSPGAGAVLSAGTHTLTAVFTYSGGSLTITHALTVAKATPRIMWPAPAPLTAGAPVGGQQLNASADVAGTFTYTPSAGTVLGAGTHAITVQFTPSDAADYTTAEASVSLNVSAAAPASGPVQITSPGAGTTVAGLVGVSAQINDTLDAAGSYLMVDGQPTGPHETNGPYLYLVDTHALSNGQHTLRVWAHDINNSTLLSPPITISVKN